MVKIDFDWISEISQSLKRNRSRTFLTGFGVFWGIFMLLALIGGGRGLKELLSKELEGFAFNSGFLFTQQTNKPYKGFRSGRTWSLNQGDVERIRRFVPEADVVTSSLSVWGSQAIYEDRNARCTVKGVYPEYTSIEAPKLKWGRYITRTDLDQMRKVCVIGKRVLKDLFPGEEDPCGRFISIGGIYFQIVGVDFSEGGVSINGNSTYSIVMPITVAQQLYGRGDDVDIIMMTAKPGVRIKDVLAKSRELICKEHYVDPTDERALVELNAEEMFAIIDNLFGGLNILIWLVGFGTLLAAAIGVSNIMMVTVRERTTEIGIRRAIGATPRVILSQIMLESLSLTLVFGMLGILFSVFVLDMTELAMTTDGILKAHFQVSFPVAMAAVAILTVLGLLAGLAPAMRAMKIRPVDAMRDE